MARVLVACEFSGIVREAFWAAGHHAVSVDLLPSEIPGSHYCCDIFDFVRCTPYAFDPLVHWDLMIAFPPCTHLAVSGARWFKGRENQQKEAIEFVRSLMNLSIPRIAIENPIGVLSTAIRKPDQIIQPWQFGHGETKATCLWLKGLPQLVPTKIVTGRRGRVHHEPPSPARWKNRSRTYTGIAKAMAEQWAANV